MPRAIWSGSISFGLVNIPVKLYSAVQRKTVRFHQLDSKDNTRIQQKRVNPATGEEVPYEQLVKGYELSPDHYVVITPEELDSLQPEKTRTIDIEAFVDLEQIDPIFYDHPYYLLPDKGAEKAYALLLQAIRDASKVGIARVVIRSKENLVAIRPREGILTMETLLFGDEVIDPDSFDELPESKEAKASKREVDMAKQLIGSLATAFDPDEYRDTYRDAVLDLIERKSQGEEVVVQAPEEPPEKVPDLMAALEASIQGAKRQTGKPKKAKAKASTDGKPKSGGKRKKTPAKT